jgi:nucleoside-diphosphate-sugar epimerase
VGAFYLKCFLLSFVCTYIQQLMKLKIILTGATGMVGEGVLLECLNHPEVEQVLMVNRKHLDTTHPKLKELLLPNFMNLDAVEEELKGYNACFFCAGISSAGLNEEQYTHITYDITMHFAQSLVKLNPGMVFNFISGSHTDSSEKGRLMWARVKGAKPILEIKDIKELAAG